MKYRNVGLFPSVPLDLTYLQQTDEAEIFQSMPRVLWALKGNRMMSQGHQKYTGCYTLNAAIGVPYLDLVLMMICRSTADGEVGPYFLCDIKIYVTLGL